MSLLSSDVQSIVPIAELHSVFDYAGFRQFARLRVVSSLVLRDAFGFPCEYDSLYKSNNKTLPNPVTDRK